MQMPLRNLRDLHRGEDIWLIASGRSLDYVDPEFFANKLTLGINHVYSRFSTDYLLVRDHHFFADVYQGALATGATLIAARDGFLNPRERRPNVPDAELQRYYVFDCEYPTSLDGLDLSAVGTDTMIAGMSTIHTAMHVCAYLGARNIMLCGADGGLLDGEKFFTGYRDGTHPNVGDFKHWLGYVERQAVRLRDRLREVYGCQVYSLNPFVNFNLEGHTYTHA